MYALGIFMNSCGERVEHAISLDMNIANNLLQVIHNYRSSVSSLRLFARLCRVTGAYLHKIGCPGVLGHQKVLNFAESFNQIVVLSIF